MAVLTAAGAACAPASAAAAATSLSWSGVGGLGTPHWALSQTVVAAADTTPPVMTITSPTEGQHVSLNGALNAAYTCQDEDGGSGANVCTSNALDTSTAGKHTFTVMTSDVAGNTDSKSVNYIVDADTTPPVITISAPVEGQHYALGTPVTPVVSCSDGIGSGVVACSAPPLVDTTTVGARTYTATAVDAAGNPATKIVHYVVDPDTTPPVITITSPTEGQHVALNSALTAEFSCVDELGGSGANSCTSNAVDTSTAGAHAFVVATSDNAANATTKTVNYVVDPDTGPPVITITTPTEGQHFALGRAVAGAYSCNDTGTAVSTCSESSPLDTSTAGPHAYTVTASDAAGNVASKTVNYVVDAAGGGGGATGTGGTGTGTGGTGAGTGGTGAGTGGTGNGTTTARATFALGTLPASFTPSSAGAIRLLVRCTAAVTCGGTAKITVPRSARSKATIVIASARYAVAAKKSARIVIKLNPIGRKRVRLSRTALRATLTVTPSDRRIKAVKRSIKLKRPRR